MLVGFQKYEKKFDNGFGLFAEDAGAPVLLASVTKATEQLLLAGVRVKLAPLSYLSVQYGMLKNELEYVAAGVANKLSIDKNVILADVTVNF